MGFWDLLSKKYLRDAIEYTVETVALIEIGKEALCNTRTFILGLVSLGAKEELVKAKARTENYQQTNRRQEEEIEKLQRDHKKTMQLAAEEIKAKEKELAKLKKEDQIKEGLRSIDSAERSFRSIWEKKEEFNARTLLISMNEDKDRINYVFFMKNLHKKICERSINKLIEKESEVRQHIITECNTQRLAGSGKEESDRQLIITREQVAAAFIAGNRRIEALEQQNLLLQANNALLIEDNNIRNNRNRNRNKNNHNNRRNHK